MVALSRCLGSLTLLAGAESARVSRKHSSSPSTKFIAGIPVLNYHTAYGGKASLGELGSVEEQGWVVMLKPGTSDAKIKDLCKAAKNGCKFAGHPGGVPFFEMKGTELDLQAVLESAGGAARYAEPDNEVHMIPEIEASPEAATWGLTRIGADERGRFSGSGSTVFVLDTGVRLTHQEFGGRAVAALDMSSGSPVECTGDASCARDVDGHGTHCAGTAGGETFGVAPNAAIRSIKVLSDQGSGSWSWSYYALDWLAVNPTRPAVASMSLGGSGNQQAMVDAVDGAVNGGVTVVVAGGNSNDDACSYSPAFVPSAITVGSMTSTDARSSFSNYGSCTDIWAPGSSVVSASVSSDTGSSTLSGTSMACPHVSGGAALVLEMDPSRQPSGVLEELVRNAEMDALTGLRPGDVNVLLSVREFYTGPPTPPPPTPAPPPPPPPGTFEVSSGTGCTKTGNCIQSNNHPSDYGNNEECTITAAEIDLAVEAFSTESGYDFLNMGGTSYSGTSGPAGGLFSGTISWASDYSVVSSGWRLCSGSSPGPVPTPAPTTQSPTPAPTTPAPTTPAPTTPAPPAPTPPSSGNCSSWCEPPADCIDYPYSCSGCCDGSPSPSPPSPPPSGDCYSICDLCSDLDNYPSICGGCTDLC